LFLIEEDKKIPIQISRDVGLKERKEITPIV